jgi:hypothetical protein
MEGKKIGSVDCRKLCTAHMSECQRPPRLLPQHSRLLPLTSIREQRHLLQAPIRYKAQLVAQRTRKAGEVHGAHTFFAETLVQSIFELGNLHNESKICRAYFVVLIGGEIMRNT